MADTAFEDNTAVTPDNGLRVRLRALCALFSKPAKMFRGYIETWWDGADTFCGISIYTDQPRVVRITAPAKTAAPDAPSALLHGKQVEAIQSVWGEGFMEPGGSDSAISVLAPANVKPTDTILDLTIGFGGTAVTAATRDKLWIEALEPEPQFAEIASKNIQISKVSERVSVTPTDFDKLSLPEKRYDLIYSRERLFAMENKALALRAVADGLKDNGTLIVTDLVATENDANAAAYENWVTSERIKPAPWTRNAYLKTLEKLGFTIRLDEDVTDDYLTQIHHGWKAMMRCVKERKGDSEYTDCLLQEGDFWRKRADALQSKALSLHKFHAIRAPRKTRKSAGATSISAHLKPRKPARV